MKVGDIVRYRIAWKHDDEGRPVPVTTEDDGWSEPVLVVKKYSSDDDGLFIVLQEGFEIVLSGPDENYEIDVISDAT